MQIDRLRRMALFTQVVRHGSFSAAARAQDLATSALSAAVSQLEEELGIRLLNRTTRRLSLTEAGQGFYDKCVVMVASAEAAEEWVAEQSSEISGRLRVSAAADVAERLVLPALAPLAERYPKLLLDLQVTDQIVNMAEQSIDLSIRSGWLRDSSLVARKLADFQEVLVAAPSYLDRHGQPTIPDQLREHRIIGFSRFTEPTTLVLKNNDGSIRVVMAAAAITDSVNMLRGLALNGLGLARLPRPTVQADLASGLLQELLPDWSLPGAGVYAVTLKRTLQPPKVVAAIEALSSYLTATWA